MNLRVVAELCKNCEYRYIYSSIRELHPQYYTKVAYVVNFIVSSYATLITRHCLTKKHFSNLLLAIRITMAIIETTRMIELT
jgi:hypothetical protein